MDRNTVIGLVLIFLILIGYSWWTMPSKEEQEAAQQKQDSIEMVRQVQDSLRILEMEAEIARQQALDTVITDTPVAVEENARPSTARLGTFASSGQGEDTLYTLHNGKYDVRIASKGGRIAGVTLRNFVTFDTLPVVLLDQEHSNFEFTFFVDQRSVSTSDLYFVPVQQSTSDDSSKIVMRAYAGNGDSLSGGNKYIEFVYALRPDDYMLDFDLRFVGLQQEMSSNVEILLDWTMDKVQMEKSLKNEKTLTTIYYKDNVDDVGNLTERKDDDEDLSTGAKWIGFKQQFFTATLLYEQNFSAVKIKAFTNAENTSPRYLRTLEAQIGLPFERKVMEEYTMQFYFGPTKYRILRKYDQGFERQIPLGWSFAPLAWINRFAVIPVFNFLESFKIGYGIIILILTILLKILLLPIAYKTYMSSAKMRVLRPEVEEIGKKFPKKEDSLKKQQATMELYKKAGASPMAGCVPMLLQFPILIAMFRFFPASIELRQQSFLWATDLSSYDSILDLGFSIPFYGDHVSLFTLLMTVSTILYTYMNNQMMGSTQQVPGMKTMMYLMPVMFLGFFNSYASGLSYYYLLANLITFAQMGIFRRFVDEDALHKKIQENKKKPVKKSKFQQRLEDAAKQRGYNPSKKK